MIKKLDKIFSEYIRMRYADANGIVRCVTCGKPDHWKFMDCGHFIPRGNHSVRWDEINCAPQCKICNQLEGGRTEKFQDYLIEQYGAEAVEMLIGRGHSPLKLFDWEIQAMIEYYTNKVKKLSNEN